MEQPSGSCSCGPDVGAGRHWPPITGRRGPAERLGRGLRVFFCYPTTGTASEGYRDYLKDVDLPKGLIHGRAEVNMRLLSLGDDDQARSGQAVVGEDEPGGPASTRPAR